MDVRAADDFPAIAARMKEIALEEDGECFKLIPYAEPSSGLLDLLRTLDDAVVSICGLYYSHDGRST